MEENPQRLTPYLNFRFKLKIDGKHVAGLSKVSGLSRSTEVNNFREGSDPGVTHKVPMQTEYSPITLERGVSYDASFAQWCNKVWDCSNSSEKDKTSLTDFRKDITIELYNEAGQMVLAYKVYKAWPSEFKAIPDLDSGGDTLVIQSLVLQNEGWEIDNSIKPPKEGFPI